MPAYYIALGREMADDWWEKGRPYREQVEATMALYAGYYTTYLRHRVEVVEGAFGLIVGPTIVEFPSWDQLWAWYHSDEYAPLKALRQQHNRFDVMLVDGLNDAELTENQRLVSLGKPGVK